MATAPPPTPIGPGRPILSGATRASARVERYRAMQCTQRGPGPYWAARAHQQSIARRIPMLDCVRRRVRGVSAVQRERSLGDPVWQRPGDPDPREPEAKPRHLRSRRFEGDPPSRAESETGPSF